MSSNGQTALGATVYRGVEPAAEDLTNYVGHFMRVVSNEIGPMSLTDQDTTNALTDGVGVLDTPTLDGRSDYIITEWGECYVKVGTGGVTKDSELFPEFSATAAKRGRAINIATANLDDLDRSQGIALESGSEGDLIRARRIIGVVRIPA